MQGAKNTGTPKKQVAKSASKKKTAKKAPKSQPTHQVPNTWDQTPAQGTGKGNPYGQSSMAKSDPLRHGRIVQLCIEGWSDLSIAKSGLADRGTIARIRKAIPADQLPSIQDTLRRKWGRVTAQSLEIIEEQVELMQQGKDSLLKPGQIPWVAAVGTDKVRDLSGGPTAIIQHERKVDPDSIRQAIDDAVRSIRRADSVDAGEQVTGGDNDGRGAIGEGDSQAGNPDSSGTPHYDQRGCAVLGDTQGGETRTQSSTKFRGSPGSVDNEGVSDEYFFQEGLGESGSGSEMGTGLKRQQICSNFNELNEIDSDLSEIDAHPNGSPGPNPPNP